MTTIHVAIFGRSINRQRETNKKNTGTDAKQEAKNDAKKEIKKST